MATPRTSSLPPVRWSENALIKGIVESFEGLIYVSSSDYRIEYINEQLIKRKSPDIVHETCFKALHDRSSPCPFCVKDQVRMGQTVRFEVKDPRDQRWYLSVNTPLFHEDGQHSHLSMITDVHDRKMAEIGLKKSAEQLRRENILLKSSFKQRHKFGSLVGRSAPMQAVYEQILTAAASDATVIIYGEPGTGKELVANAIHDMSERRGHRFVPVHCGAIPENLIESEFFGYRKGAFSGADSQKEGYLDYADSGTLFLDEIGDISLNLQIKLLRVIDGGGYTPVGGTAVNHADFRVIAATNRNLTELIEAGRMREDFFYRIHILPIHLPPLRQRKEDLPLLFDHFLRLHGGKQNIPPLPRAMQARLKRHDWPGNVRELQNVALRYCTLKRLDLTPTHADGPPDTPVGSWETVRKGTLKARIAVLEEQAIRQCLEKHRWNRTRAARELGVDRKTLYHKIRQYGLR